MEWNIEEKFSIKWNMERIFSMEWKIFGMEWKWNGRKLPVWNTEKSSSIPFQPCPALHNSFQVKLKPLTNGHF